MPKSGSAGGGAKAKTPTKRTAAKKAVAVGPTKKQSAKKKPVKKAAKKKAAVKKKRSSTKATTEIKPAAKKKSNVKKKSTVKTASAKRAPTKKKAVAKRKVRPMIGWREWVVLPDLSPEPIKAKVDTGAVTSAIHAFDLELLTEGENTIARFGVASKQGRNPEMTRVEHHVVGFKNVRSSNGQTELRPVINTRAQIGQESFEIHITLASRDAMGFRMLLGRKAVRKRFWVDPGRSYLQPPITPVTPSGCSTEGGDNHS